MWHDFHPKYVRDVTAQGFDVLMITLIVEKDMVVLAVVLEYAQKGPGAGRGGSR